MYLTVAAQDFGEGQGALAPEGFHSAGLEGCPVAARHMQQS